MRAFRTAVAGVSGLVFLFLGNPAASVASDRLDHVAGRLLAGHRQGVGLDAAARAAAERGARLRRHIPALGVSILDVPEESSEAAIRALRQSGLFDYVERDYYAQTGATPNDPHYSAQWHLPQIQAPQAWNITTGSSSIVVAVIDSGVDGTHPDLSSKLVPGWNFVGNNSNTADVLGHGTAVAGTLAAASNNGIGVAGVNWSSRIMPLVVVDSSDYASYSNIAAAIQYAADNGARVINISLGGSTPSAYLQSAVNYAWSKGAIIFASAMNYSTTAPYYPAACANVLAISATDGSDHLASFSNYGNWIALAAPGNNIFTTNMGGGYGYWYGTSFSSPIVAGVAALALAANPLLSNTALVTLLEQNADDLGPAGFDTSYGWGRVNAYKAALAAQTSATPPAISISPKTVSLSEGQSQNFTAAVTGLQNTAVTWTVSPAVGTIAGGSYTAPASVTAAQNVTVTATAANGMAASATVPLIPTATVSSTPFRINAGGPAYTDATGTVWAADEGYMGGSVGAVSNPIANTNAPAVFQAYRYGQSFGYQFNVPNGSYTVNLNFAETQYSAAGQRVFNVALDGTTVLANFDIFAQAGGANTALTESFPVTVTNGQISIQLSAGAADSPLINGVEILSAASSQSTTITPLFRINAGGAAYTDTAGALWAADADFASGYTWSVSNPITNTSAPGLYQTCRYGSSFSYKFSVPNGQRTVVLKFAEVSRNAAGRRVFNVSINGSPALTNFDIFAQAGGEFIALDKSFPVTVTNGQIVIQFSTGPADWPMINGIEID